MFNPENFGKMSNRVMTEEEFAEWLSQIQLDKYWQDLYHWYSKAAKYDALIEYDVDQWEGFAYAMQSLENETDSRN